MNKLYFTSDTHFGHKNILHYTPKRCADVDWDGRKNIWSLEEIIEYFNDKKIKFDNNNEIVHWRDGDGWHYNIKNDNINQIIEDLLARQNYK